VSRGWSRRRGRQLLEVLPVDTEAALGAAHRLDAVIRPDFRRALVAGVGAVIALSFGSTYGDGLHSRELHTKLIVSGVAIAFVVFGVVAIRSAANEVQRVVRARGGASAGTTVRLLITLLGYLIILLAVLGMLAVPLGRLLVGGAITGIVVGIAAQQSLGNIFAGLVLLLARPYVIGEHIRVRSGALGGPIDGTVVGMDLLYTTLETEEGLVRLPNAGLLASAVGPRPKNTADSEPPSVADVSSQDTTQGSGLPDGQHDPDRQSPHDDDRPQQPLRNPARHGSAELGPDDRAQREDPRRAPRG
jgi:small conductance mechanosensitive channel